MGGFPSEGQSEGNRTYRDILLGAKPFTWVFEVCARVQISSAPPRCESCPDGFVEITTEAARFLLRLYPLVRPHQLDGHIRKEQSHRLAVRRAAMLG